jgi:hypothetical protein
MTRKWTCTTTQKATRKRWQQWGELVHLKKNHEDDQPHMIKRRPCTIMEYKTIKGNENEMMIACMHTCSCAHTIV